MQWNGEICSYAQEVMCRRQYIYAENMTRYTSPPTYLSRTFPCTLCIRNQRNKVLHVVYLPISPLSLSLHFSTTLPLLRVVLFWVEHEECEKFAPFSISRPNLAWLRKGRVAIVTLGTQFFLSSFALSALTTSPLLEIFI